MEYRIHSFRHAQVVLQEPKFIETYNEIIQTLNNITELDIIDTHNAFPEGGYRRPKSISIAINHLFRDRLIHLGWQHESPIFQEQDYIGETWRLDFAKGLISMEVAFNHSTVIAWNLIKPVLASELNHVNKAIQTEVGILITATQSMKTAGGFDGAIGTFEKFLTYLAPMRDILSVPLLIIGLEAPLTFKLSPETINGRKEGFIEML